MLTSLLLQGQVKSQVSNGGHGSLPILESVNVQIGKEEGSDSESRVRLIYVYICLHLAGAS